MTSGAALVRAPFPPRATRATDLARLLGEMPRGARPLADAVRRLTRAQFTREILPLVELHAPELLGTPFMEKLRIGACDLYAVAPYLALLCGDAAPRPMRALVTVVDRLPLDDEAFARLAGGLGAGRGARVRQREQRQIARVAAFIVMVDHALDHGMPDPPLARGERLKAILRGTRPPDTGALSLARALLAGLHDDLATWQRADLARALDHIDAWIDAEVQALAGQPDPAGLSHRQAGVEGTIEGLLFPVARWTGPQMKAWLNGVSMFVQCVDDLLDIEHDLRDGRETPATEGRWTVSDAGAAWRETVAGLERLARLATPGSRALARRIAGAYRVMMIELIGAMAARPEDGC